MILLKEFKILTRWRVIAGTKLSQISWKQQWKTVQWITMFLKKNYPYFYNAGQNIYHLPLIWILFSREGRVYIDRHWLQ